MPVRQVATCYVHRYYILRLKVTQALNASSNGGDASRVGKRCSFYLVEFVSPFSTPQDEAAEN